MSKSLNSIVDRLSNIPDIAGLGDIIELIKSVYQVDHVYYYAISLGLDTPIFHETRGGGMTQQAGLWRRDGRSMAAITYTPDWIHRYFEANFQTVDPVLLGASEGFAPMDWQDLDWSAKGRRQFLHEAVEHGVGNQGFTVPIHGPNGQFAIFTVNKNCGKTEWARLIGEYSNDFMLLAHYTHQRALHFARVDTGPADRPLSARERDALGLIADGLSRGQAADRLGISENTFRVYIDSARHKLGALNIPHAIALAAYKGVITPQ